MAYQTGTVNSIADIKSVVETFATANGWTLSGGVLSRDGCFVRFIVESTTLLRCEIATSAAFTTFAAVGHVKHDVWPSTYHIFALSAPHCIYMVLRYNTEWHKQLSFGNALKYGTWTGGGWLSAPNHSSGHRDLSVYLTSSAYAVPTPSGVEPGFANERHSSPVPFLPPHYNSFYTGTSFMHCELDGKTWAVPSPYQNTTYTWCVTSPYWAQLLSAQPNAWNGQAVLMPFHLWAFRASNMISLIGEIPHIRALRIDNFESGDLLTIGTDQWMAFPMVRKDTVKRDGIVTTSDAGSGTFGWAIRYVP